MSRRSYKVRTPEMVRFTYEVIERPEPFLHSSDQPSSDYYLFTSMQLRMGRKNNMSSDEKVKEVMEEW